MSKFRKDEKKETPALSSGSMSDIVFMLLFFFMVTTQMRNCLMLQRLSNWKEKILLHTSM